MPTQIEDDVFTISDRVRRDLGLVEPPANAAGLLKAHQLTLPEKSLEVILLEAGLQPGVIQKLDAMLDPGDRCVFVRDDMHERQNDPTPVSRTVCFLDDHAASAAAVNRRS